MILAGLAAVVAAAAAGKAALMGTSDAPSGAPKRVDLHMGGAEGSGATGPQGKTQSELLAANQQAQQRISILGEMATVEQLVTQKQLELNAAGLQGVGVNDQMAAKILNATRAQAEMNRVTQQSSIGVFSLTDATKAASDTLQMYIDKV